MLNGDAPSIMTGDKKLLSIDWEGVIYDQNPATPPLDKPPRPGAFNFLTAAMEYFDVMVVSEYAHNFILHRWFKRFGWTLDYKTGHPEGLQLETRPPRFPHRHIGTRVHRFTGEWPSLIELTKALPHLDERQKKKTAVISREEHPT